MKNKMQLQLLIGMSLACHKGGGSWSDDAYRDIGATKSYATKSARDIFSRSLHADLDPNGVKFRESRDSDEHPESLPVAVFLDVTGSMGSIPEKLIKGKLGALMSTIIAHGVPHPQLMFGAITDQYANHTPLQVGQFESDTALIDSSLSKIYLEGGGGGDQHETYPLAWLFCGRHTSLDSFEKRGIKGFLFTIGDEGFHEKLSADKIKQILGDGVETDLDSKDLLLEAQRMYHVFHIHVNEGQYPNNKGILGQWHGVLGERVLILDDHTVIAELIASTVAVINGVDLKDVTKHFDKSTATSVSNALALVSKGLTAGKKEGIVKL